MTSNTSNEVYHNEIKGAKEESQDLIILKKVASIQPCTAIQVKEICPKLQINVISRALNNLRKRELIEIAFDAKCRITNRKVHHYQVIPK